MKIKINIILFYCYFKSREYFICNVVLQIQLFLSRSEDKSEWIINNERVLNEFIHKSRRAVTQYILT